MPGQISIGDDTFTIAAEEQLPRGRRGIVRSTRSTQPGDPSQRQTYRWALAGPLGLSRERDDGFLGVDYASLEHRYPQLLTSLPKRNTSSLTAPASSVQYGAPDATVDTTNWAEGAGDGDGDAHDELGNGIDGGTPNDATYWSTTTARALLKMGLPNFTDPGIDTDHKLRVRWRSQGGDVDPWVYLVHNSVPIATLVRTVGVTVQEDVGTVPEGAIATITDYTDLEVWVVGPGSGGLDAMEVELEVPDEEAADRVSFIQEDRGFLVAARGRRATLINPASMEEIENNDRTNTIKGMAFAGGEGLLSYGTAKVAERRSAVSATSATYTAIANSPKAHAMRYGSDRLWFVDADADDGALKFSFDGLVTISNIVKAGDQSVASTGIGVYGPYGLVGRRNGYFGFTNNGQTVRTIEGMDAFASELNGAASDSGFGWHYVAHKLGLATLVPGAVDNNAGPFAIPDFEGPIDGVVTAVFRWKGFLWITILTDINDSASGTLWLLRGVFNPQITPGTGQLDWFTVDKHDAVNAYALGATAGRPVAEATLVRGSGVDVAFYDLAFRDREISRSGYSFSTEGGEWFGSTLVRGPNRRKTIRQYHVRVKNVDEANTWQLAVELDEDDSFSDVGAVIDSGDDGIRSVKSATGTPLTPQGLSGFAIKPRFTQVAGGESLSDIALNELDNLAGHWPLGEASGDAIDGSTNSNDGTVTLGAGARAEAALNVDGDGSMLFDGADTKVQIGDDSAIQNIFDGGGSIFFMFDADSDGEASFGTIWKKTSIALFLGGEAAGLLQVKFSPTFSGDDGLWVTDVDIPIDTTIIGVLTYDADSVGNDPTLYIWDGSSLSTRTVSGGDLTESTTPTGTRNTDVGGDAVIGNNISQGTSFDGHVDEIMLFSDILTANEAETLINRARLGYAPPSLEGFLDIEVDERPDNVEALEVPVILQGRDYDLLKRYAIETVDEEALYRSPVKISFDDLDTYGFVLGLSDVQDVDAGDGAQRAMVSIVLWDTS